MKNPFQQLVDLYNKPQMVPGIMAQETHLTKEDKALLNRIGLTATQVRKDLQEDTQIFYDRWNIYHAVEHALEHPIVGAATELYANYCTVYSPLHNSTCWITSESPTYQRELTKLLDRIGIEEKIFDWAFTTGSYGDMFVKIDGIPGKGIISINDSQHPINMSRVDHEGVLIGFYTTPLGQVSDQQRLLPPWDYVHFRLLGGKKQRPQFGDNNFAEFRTMNLLTGMRTKQVTTSYGCSLLMNALPCYRRLRLAEDSLLLARLSRGLIRYIWKLRVDSGNMEAVGELVDQYSRVLREARSVNTSPDSPNFEEKENPMCLRGDTRISLVDRTNPTIEEMAKNSKEYIGKFVWSINEKTLDIEIGRIKNVRKTRLNAELIRVYLDNDQYVDTTPDHKFMLQDGSYVEAEQLQLGTKLRVSSEGFLKLCQESVPECSSDIIVVKIEKLDKREDTYDIEIDGPPNFPLTAGVYVHNSAIEDIFLPVFGDNVGDLTFDKIGGETDIRWIRDIEDLRQQLAAALRTPLPLLGAWLKEASGALGSEAIEKVDINFARMARKLQRTIATGIKRICQIHLAYMNMDPDPTLFDVQMPEMSTAEEESLKTSLRDGMDIVDQMVDTVNKVIEGSGKRVDTVEIFNYCNEKFLKLEDFDLAEYVIGEEEVPVEEIPEEEAIPESMCIKRKKRLAHELEIKRLLEKSISKTDKDRLYPKPTLFNTDLMSYVPTIIHDEKGMLIEKIVKKLGRNGNWLGTERCMGIWQEKFGDALVVESDSVEDVVGQMALPFEEKES
ncbi:MAG: portal protein [Candidatus Heimdallarchaeaceae archaeon]